MRIRTKPVKGYEGYYTISNNGDMFSCGRRISYSRKKPNKKICFRVIKERKMKLDLDYQGYLQIRIQKEGKKVCFKIHRLVGQAFIPNPNNRSLYQRGVR